MQIDTNKRTRHSMARAKDETTIKLATPSKPENKIVSVETDMRAMFDNVVQYLYLDRFSK